MGASVAAHELLFSYGTLRLEAVQMELFGRQLSGTPDALPGFTLASLTIDDEAVVAISGQTHHTMATFTGRPSDVIVGTVLTLTPGEIQNADKYEVEAVERVSVVLQSGIRAWAYVDARYAPPAS
jgi:Gamma-glutamyl cyclotransferase, AIG2-like